MANITASTEDSEVQNILNNNPSMDSKDDKLLSPGSPVLSNNLTRKLGNKMMFKRKSRVKLTDRFDAKSSMEPLDEQIQKFREESFTLAQENNIAVCLEKLETIDNNRQLWYNKMVENKQYDSCFRKPSSVTCSRPHKKMNDIHFDVSQEWEQLDSNLPPVNIPVCSNFQTAAGKVMQISDCDIKKQALIFQDLHKLKIKKHNFLRKVDTGQKGVGTSAGNFNTSGIIIGDTTIIKGNQIERSGIEKNVAGYECAELKNLKETKSSSCTIREDPEVFSKDTSISLTQEISKSGISNTQILSIVDNHYLVENNSEKEDSEHGKKVSDNNMSVKSSQQVEETSISNTQMMCAVEDYLNQEGYNKSKYQEKDIFVGFSKKDIEQSSTYVHGWSNILRRLSSTSISCQSETNVSKKRVLELDQLPSCKKIKLYPFNDINSINVTSGHGGFSSASGKHINITSKALAEASHIFDNIGNALGKLETNKYEKKEKTDSSIELKFIPKSFSKQQCTYSDITESSLNKKQSVYNTQNDTAGRVQKTVTADDSKIDNKNILNNINCNIVNGNTSPTLTTASNNLIMVHEESKIKEKQIFGNMLDNTSDDSIASMTSNNKLRLDDAIKKADVFSKSEDSTITCSEELQNMSKGKLGFANASGKVFQVSESSLAKAKQMFGDLIGKEAESASRLVSKSKFKLLDEAIRKAEINMGVEPSSVEDDFQKKNFKNRTLPILPPQQRNPLQSISLRTQIAENSNIHTPKREDTVLKKAKRKLGISSCKQISISEQTLMKAKLLFDQEVHSISPIKPIELNMQSKHNTPSHSEASFSRIDRKYCSTPLPNNFNTLKDLPVSSQVTHAISMLEDQKLDQKSFFIFETPSKRSLSDWVKKYEEERMLLEERLSKIKDRETELLKLHQSKMNDNKRRSLGVLYQKKKLSSRLNLKSLCDGVSNCGDNNQDMFSVTPENAANFHFKCDIILKTEDGATIIPNLDNLVGLSEIQMGIETMANVEARLIPKDWIKNHYKWIVWKLASYERKFYSKCLSIENVVQQLKYRYDREIDKVERSALRKILERDDVSQKRVVLCVSAVRRKGLTQFELELTDGWYGVRTVIDDALCAQVYGKIQIGTKLITCGAELLNCDGCHPLEATDLVCLRINYNNTRRARWYTKLGYQKYPQPFPVKICSIHPSGGIVGAIKICIIRVYPLKFLEKLGTNSVWRNQRAEERRAQEWENEVSSNIEKNCSGNRNDSQSSGAEIKNLIKRDVSVVLRLLVIDLLDTGNRTYNFHIWMPSENHLHDLREGKSMTVYNVLPKKNGDLSSCKKTMFKPINLKLNLLDKFIRRVTLIEDISTELMADFREFDTVGIIVQTVIEDNLQKVWIAGLSGRLLLVRINQGPKLCSVLEHARRGQSMAVSNLLLSFSSKVDILQASANNYSVFSLYPMQKHLQKGLDAFNKEFIKDVDVFLNDCDNKIELFNSCEGVKHTSLSKMDDSDEDTLTTSRLTSTDVALSLIDIDKFI